MNKIINYLPFLLIFLLVVIVVVAVHNDKQRKLENETELRLSQDSIKKESEKRSELERKLQKIEEQRKQHIQDSLIEEQNKIADLIQNHPIKSRISIGHGLYIGMTHKEYEKALRKFTVKRWKKKPIGDGSDLIYYELDYFRFTKGNEPSDEFTPVDASFNNCDNLISLSLRSGEKVDTYRPNAQFRADIGPLDYDYRYFVKRLNTSLLNKYHNKNMSVETSIEGPYDNGTRFNSVYVVVTFKYVI